MPTAEEHLAQFRARYDVIYAPTAEARAKAVAEHGADIEIVLTIGAVGLRADEIAAMPKLRAAAAQGPVTRRSTWPPPRRVASRCGTVRAPTIHASPTTRWRCCWPPCARCRSRSRPCAPDCGATRCRCVRASTGASSASSAWARSGCASPGARWPSTWRSVITTVASATTRWAAQYFGSALELAQWADFLIVAAPGGPTTKHIVNAEVLKALGPQGHVVNIARGSLVDTAALAAALAAGELGGAALDVYESRPKPPEAPARFPERDPHAAHRGLVAGVGASHGRPVPRERPALGSRRAGAHPAVVDIASSRATASAGSVSEAACRFCRR